MGKRLDFIIRRHFLNGQRKLDNLPDDVVGASVEGATVVVAGGGGGGRAMQPSPLEKTSERVTTRESRVRTLISIMIRTNRIAPESCKVI